MQARRPLPVSPLDILLPHPQLPRKRSSLLSTSSSSPRTPLNANSPLCTPTFLFAAANRKSTDSWNSSNQDELEFEWKPEQTLLLSRTLDALPAHLLTPFNGPVPPSNLLDKIARGVSNAKGPLDWPHSIRATRVKLMELARIRAKETAKDENRNILAQGDEHTSSPGEVFQQSTNTVTRRPLYRQSSMDFMNTSKTDLKDNDNITRLSNRLQRTDRLIHNSGYHPYSRPSLCPSPSNISESHHNPGLNPSPSSITLKSSTSSSSSSTRSLRRSMSNLSSYSDCYLAPLPEAVEDPYPRRIRRTDSVRPPASCREPRQMLKRAPSFRVTARDNRSISPDPSSDEEEKIRTKQAKKARTKPGTPSPPPMPPPKSPEHPHTMPKEYVEIKMTTGTKKSSSSISSSSKSSSTAKSTSTAATTVVSKSSRSASIKPRANLERNPSIFGAELPHPQIPPAMPVRSPRPNNEQPPTVGPASPQKTLRRVRATSFARSPARRISFGSLVAPPEETIMTANPAGGQLGSAIQLR